MRNDILEQAEVLFFKIGYKQTSLNSIANASNMKAASLYYHFPGGKEEIYIEVLRIRLLNYKSQIYKVMTDTSNLEKVFHDFSNWYLDQPPMNMTLISEFDMPQLTSKGQKEVMGLISSCLFMPLRDFISNAKPMLKDFEPMRIVGIYFSLLNSLAAATKKNYTSRDQLVSDFIEILLRGILKNKNP